VGDMAENIREHLIGTTSVTDLVSVENIFVSNSPMDVAGKQIIIKDIPGESHPVLPLEEGQMTLLVVVDDSIPTPYAICRAIADVILSTLNKKNESLRNSTAQVRWFLKTGVEFVYNSDENYWMGAVTFNYVEGGIVE